MKLSIVERAYQLAESGACTTLSAIKLRLKHEGFIIATIEQSLGGKGTSLALQKLCRVSREKVDKVRLEPTMFFHRRSATYDIRDLIRAARDRGEVVDVSVIASKLSAIHPTYDRDQLTAMIMEQASAAGVDATWVSEHNKTTDS